MKRLIPAGLLAGLIVNLVDVPNSAIVVSPRWVAFLEAHNITLNVPLVSAFYTTLHFLYGIAIAYAYVIARDRYGAGIRTALASTGFLLLLHRAFGLGMVVMGTMPLSIYLMFSASMILGSLLGGVAAAKVLDRA